MALARIVLLRTGRAVATLVALAVLAWGCLEVASAPPAERAARAAGLLPPGADLPAPYRRQIIADAAHRFGLDRPAPERLVGFVAGAAHGDFGRSWRDGGLVSTAIVRALPVTLGSILVAALLAYLAGLAGALLAASHPGGLGDRAVGLVTALLLALPPAWAAILLLDGAGRFALRSYAAPIACLAYVAAATVARHGRAALVDAAAQPFADAARARGASPTRVLGVHALAVAAAPIASLVALLVPYLLGASLVVERAFALHGLGALVVDAAGAGDAPVVLGGTLAAGAIVAATTIFGDLLCALADPRLRATPELPR